MKLLRISSLALAAVAISLAFAAPVALFQRTNLLSDGVLATPNVDANLVNSWGLTSSPTGPLWIANNGTGTASIVKADGTPALPNVAIPADRSGHPTGVVFNGGNGFEVSQGATSAPSRFIFVTLEGRIIAWSPQVDSANAIVAFDGGASGAVYTGAALADVEGRTALYVANFGKGTIDVFDSNFDLAGSFTDAHAPASYAPFGIATINGVLYVTFVPHDPATGGPDRGRGHGLIDIFLPNGTRLRRLATGGELNAPWAVVKAPEGFGPLSNKLLVGNFGDGHILGFTRSGQLIGPLANAEGEEIEIGGLWGLRFGNGGTGGEPEDLYFTAGIQGETHGVFGEITLGR